MAANANCHAFGAVPGSAAASSGAAAAASGRRASLVGRGRHVAPRGLLLLLQLLGLAAGVVVWAGVLGADADRLDEKTLTTVPTTQCTCAELTGLVADCCCEVASVDDINAKLRPPLVEILHTAFFRHFHVNLHKGCPFWPLDEQCTVRDCAVSECEDEELPPSWRTAAQSMSAVDYGNPGYALQRNCDESSKDFCVVDSDNDPACHYVDLTRNPEAFTGFAGYNARRIWRSIYEENCFGNVDLSTGDGVEHAPGRTLLDGAAPPMCREERIFYRLISGMHASIATHLASRHTRHENGHWVGNDTLVALRVASHPERLENLYFAYLFVLRAVVKLSEYLPAYDLSTGNATEDARVETLVKSIVSFSTECPPTFDEHSVFTSPDADRLKNEMRAHFRNISRIMDCVACEKCRLWGKLQVTGYGTAMKILFAAPEDADQKRDFRLQRSELVALLNLMGRLSDSVEYIRQFRERVHAAAAAAGQTASPATKDEAPGPQPEDAEVAKLLGPDDGLQLLLASVRPFLPYMAALGALYVAVVLQTRRCAQEAPAKRT